MGGFVFLYYEKDKPLFYDTDLTSSDIFKVMYLASYMNYKNELVVRGRRNELKPMDRKTMHKLLNISKTAFESFYAKIIKDNVLIKENKIYSINQKYINRGKRLNGESTRIFTSVVKELFKSVEPRKHKQLGYLYVIIPYLNEDNKLNIKGLNKVLNLSSDNTSRMYKILSNFKTVINGNEYQIFTKEGKIAKIHESFCYSAGDLNPIVNITKYVTKTHHSSNETKIMEYLNSKNEFYINEMIFTDLVSDLNEHLRYDFYIPRVNTLIEFDGEFHDKDLMNDPKKFHRLKIHDEMKNEYAKRKGIKLIRIHYTEKDKIEDILESVINLK